MRCVVNVTVVMVVRDRSDEGKWEGGGNCDNISDGGDGWMVMVVMMVTTVVVSVVTAVVMAAVNEMYTLLLQDLAVVVIISVGGATCQNTFSLISFLICFWSRVFPKSSGIYFYAFYIFIN